MSALHKNPLPEAILPLLHVSRFCEWSSACWEIQKDNLLGTNLDLDLRFLALYHNDDSVHLTSAKECLVGRAMGQWWDRSNEAGPRSRENTRFQEDLPNLEVLCVNLETSTLGILGNEKKTWCWNLVSWALSYLLPKSAFSMVVQQNISLGLLTWSPKSSRIPTATLWRRWRMNWKSNRWSKPLWRVGNPSATPGTSEGQQCPRTSASPEWCGDFPWNFRKRMSHTGISIADFEGGNSWLGSIW